MSEESSRVAVVFGGASGIGAAIAARFTAEGWPVEIADLPAVDVTDEESVADVPRRRRWPSHGPARPRGQQRRASRPSAWSPTSTSPSGAGSSTSA